MVSVWLRAFGAWSFGIIHRLHQTVLQRKLESPCCEVHTFLSHPTFIIYFTYKLQFSFFLSPDCSHTSQRGGVLMRLPELYYVA